MPNADQQIEQARQPRRLSQKHQQTLELVTTGMYVAFWAQVGVLTRIYIDKVFADGCTGYWGLCLLSQGTVSATARVTQPDLTALQKTAQPLNPK